MHHLYDYDFYKLTPTHTTAGSACRTTLFWKAHTFRELDGVCLKKDSEGWDEMSQVDSFHKHGSLDSENLYEFNMTVYTSASADDDRLTLCFNSISLFSFSLCICIQHHAHTLKSVLDFTSTCRLWIIPLHLASTTTLALNLTRNTNMIVRSHPHFSKTTK